MSSIRQARLATIALAALAALGIAAIAPVAQAQGATNVQILSATVKDKQIDGATVTLQKNGEQSATATTNSQGQVTLQTTFADDANALLIVKKPGYSNLVVKCPCAGTTYAISPVMNTLDGMRIVLNWGANPHDLDSHVVYPGNHVFFSHKNGSDANLDVDNTTGFGPETITLTRKHVGERYVYAVHDYSDGGSPQTDRLGRSGAKVFVYVGQTQVKTYYVPAGTGNLWTVFAVTENGDFQDIGTLSGTTSHERLQGAEFQSTMDHATVRTASVSASGQADAKTLNTQGEAAYHAGQLDEAIALYQQAIEANGSYGQAYSNLGLAFQKAGRVSEALWANRKAIALAEGPTAATVRASSHYNNGKIYEDAGQWNDALREYSSAKAEHANAVYDKAIQRVQQKGAQ